MEHELLALPSRHGGLGLVNPMTMAEEHTSSLQVTEPLHDCTYRAAERWPGWHRAATAIDRANPQSRKMQKTGRSCNRSEGQITSLPTKSCWTWQWKGYSQLADSIPLRGLWICSPQGRFRDVLCLRYNWTPLDLPRECVCVTTFSTEHALSCSGGVTICRHNEVRDLMADLLNDVYHDVNVEPYLQPLLVKQSPPVAQQQKTTQG